MKKFLTIALAFLLTAFTVNAGAVDYPSMPYRLRMNDAETIPNGAAEITVSYDFPAEVHTLIFYVAYLWPLAVESVRIGDVIAESDTNMIHVDYSEAGQISVGVICAVDGLVGRGELLTIRFRATDSATGSYNPVHIVVQEAFSAPIGQPMKPVTVWCEYDANVVIRDLTTADAVEILRHVIGLAPAQPWYDLNEDGIINASDAIRCMRICMGVI